VKNIGGFFQVTLDPEKKASIFRNTEAQNDERKKRKRGPGYHSPVFQRSGDLPVANAASRKKKGRALAPHFPNRDLGERGLVSRTAKKKK